MFVLLPFFLSSGVSLDSNRFFSGLYFYLLHWKVGISFSDAELNTSTIGKGLKS